MADSILRTGIGSEVSIDVRSCLGTEAATGPLTSAPWSPLYSKD